MGKNKKNDPNHLGFGRLMAWKSSDLCYNITTSLAVVSYYFKYIIGNTALISVTSIFGIVLLPLMLAFP